MRPYTNQRPPTGGGAEAGGSDTGTALTRSSRRALSARAVDNCPRTSSVRARAPSRSLSARASSPRSRSISTSDPRNRSSSVRRVRLLAAKAAFSSRNWRSVSCNSATWTRRSARSPPHGHHCARGRTAVPRIITRKTKTKRLRITRSSRVGCGAPRLAAPVLTPRPPREAARLTQSQILGRVCGLSRRCRARARSVPPGRLRRSIRRGRGRRHVPGLASRPGRGSPPRRGCELAPGQPVPPLPRLGLQGPEFGERVGPPPRPRGMLPP